MVHVVIVILQFFAAFLSGRFVWRGRLGPPWLIVTAALCAMGLMQMIETASLLAEPGHSIHGSLMEAIEFSISLLFASGFALTDRWFFLKERLEGRFRLIAEVDASLVGVLDEAGILSAVCEGLTRGHGYKVAWVGAGMPDGTVEVTRYAGTQGPPSWIAVRWDDTPEGRGPTGTALRTGEPVVVNDLANDPRFRPWREVALRSGLRSAAAVRIDGGGGLDMVLTIYSPSRNMFDRLEMAALSAMATRAGNAVAAARRHRLFVNAKVAYDDLLRTQRDGVILVRGERIVRINPAAAAMLGCAVEDELVGADPVVIMEDPRACDGLRRPPDGGAICGRETAGWETAIRRRDGSTFPGEVSTTWVPRPPGYGEWTPDLSGPLGMIIIRDITRRNEALEALRRERDFSSNVLDIAGALVVQLGPGGEIVLMNRQCEAVTGYAQSEVLGKRMADLLLPASARPFHERAVAGILAGGVPPAVEYALLTRSGEERQVVWNHAPLREADGRVASVIATGTDVSESRRLERQIIEMQKMEAVGTLAGGVAHDFNNILTGILGNLDLTRRVLPAGSDALAPVQESIQASERAAQLIRQLLEFSRRSPLERRAIDLSAVVREVVHLFSQTIDRRIEVRTRLSEDLWQATADSSQAHQVLMNLCVNARDAIMECLDGRREAVLPAGGHAIEIGAGNVTIGEDYCRDYPYARPGEFILLSISDNGSGMDEATQRRVFEPFFTTKKLGRGTGLGLSTVYGIIKQHDGWINLESRPGAGTTFRAYFPRAAEPRKEREAAGEEGLPRTGKETILLVDDEEMIRDLGTRILEINGYTVITAGDGLQAIDTYVRERVRIDLVILDMTMPHLSGLDVLGRIRKLDPRAKVILSSGYLAGSGSSSILDAGASAFLQKPYRADALTRTVRSVLDAGTTPPATGGGHSST